MNRPKSIKFHKSNLAFVIIALLFIFFSTSCAENKSNFLKIIHDYNIATIKDTLKFQYGIRCVLQDSKGNYWFGSDMEGVAKYDGNKFHYYNSQNRLSGNQIISIKEQNNGIVWIETNKGLCSYNGEKIFQCPTQTILSTFKVKSTDLWFGGQNNASIIRIDNNEISYITNPIYIPAKENIGDYGITGFALGLNNDLWISYYKGVANYNGFKTKYINDSTLGYDGKNEYMHVRSLLMDSKERLWIGNNGIGVLLNQNDSIVNFSKKNNAYSGKVFVPKSPPGTLMHVFVIKEDSKGNIWFGDRDTGAWRFDGKELVNFVVDSSLKSQHIWNIYEDKKGNLLFSMAENGVYRFNGNSFDKILK